MANDPKLQHSFLIEMLRYEPETGEFFWRHDVAPTARAGKRAGCLQRTKGRKAKRQIEFCGHRLYEHRLAWFYVTGEWPKGEIDHLDTDPANNQWANLRDTDRTTNMQNFRIAPRTSSTGLLGATLAGSRFRSCINVNKKRLNLGYFDTAQAAHEAYLKAKRELHQGCTI